MLATVNTASQISHRSSIPKIWHEIPWFGSHTWGHQISWVTEVESDFLSLCPLSPSEELAMRNQDFHLQWDLTRVFTWLISYWQVDLICQLNVLIQNSLLSACRFKGKVRPITEKTERWGPRFGHRSHEWCVFQVWTLEIGGKGW